MGVFGIASAFQDQQVYALGTRTEPKKLTTATPDALTSDDFGRTIHFNRAAGVDVTLPEATGSGGWFRFIVGITVSTNDINIRCEGAGEFAGVIYQVDTDTSDAIVAYPAVAADNFDVISLNGSTTGGLVGDFIYVEDIAADVWALYGFTNGTGTVSSPLASS